MAGNLDKISIKRFNIWITDRFDCVYENFRFEYNDDFGSRLHAVKDLTEEAIDTVEIINEWGEVSINPFYYDLRTME